MTAARTAQTGMVITQDMKIRRMTFRSMAAKPRANPTPMTAPTSTSVVEMGRPSFEQTSTVVAVPNSAAKPRVGVISVIFRPTASMTL